MTESLAYVSVHQKYKVTTLPTLIKLPALAKLPRLTKLHVLTKLHTLTKLPTPTILPALTIKVACAYNYLLKSSRLVMCRHPSQ